MQRVVLILIGMISAMGLNASIKITLYDCFCRPILTEVLFSKKTEEAYHLRTRQLDISACLVYFYKSNFITRDGLEALFACSAGELVKQCASDRKHFKGSNDLEAFIRHAMFLFHSIDYESRCKKALAVCGNNRFKATIYDKDESRVTFDSFDDEKFDE